MKRIISILLLFAMALSLAACGKENGGVGGDTSAEGSAQPLSFGGRYVETDITPEVLRGDSAGQGRADNLWVREDGSVDLLVWIVEDLESEKMKYRWFHSEDQGGQWEERELPDWEGASDWFISDQGDIYAFQYGNGETATEYHQSPDGTSENVAVQFGQKIQYIGKTDVFQDKYVIMDGFNEKDQSVLYALNLADGQVVWSLETEEDANLDWTIAGDRIYVSNGGKTNAILDGETGKRLEDLNTAELHSSLSRMRINEDGTYYHIDEQGNFCRSIFDADVIETILEPQEYSYGAKSNDFYYPSRYFSVTEDGTIYLAAINDVDIVNLYRFDFDQEAQAQDKTLTVWSLNEYPTIRQAVLQFRETHPNVKVDYQVPDLEEEGKTLNDVLTTLNTQLLAGEGPDVLILDGVGYENYMEKGILSDLSDLYQEEQFVGQTVSSLLNDQGQCYVLPARFTIPVLMGTAELPDTLEALSKAVQEGGSEVEELEWDQTADGEYTMQPLKQKESERPLFAAYLDLLQDMLWDASAPSLVSEGKIEENNLRQWLQVIKEISDYYHYKSDEASVSMSSSSIGFYSYGNQNIIMEDPMIKWCYGQTQATLLELGSIEEVLVGMDGRVQAGQSVENFSIAQYPGLTEGAYVPSVLLGVSAGSEQQEIAKDFVRAALSEEIQQYTYGDGLPVLQTAVDKQLAYFAPYAEKHGWDIQQLGTLLDSRTSPVIVPEEEESVIDEAAKAYCEGSATLDEAVQSIEEKLALKLAEQ